MLLSSMSKREMKLSGLVYRTVLSFSILAAVSSTHNLPIKRTRRMGCRENSQREGLKAVKYFDSYVAFGVLLGFWGEGTLQGQSVSTSPAMRLFCSRIPGGCQLRKVLWSPSGVFVLCSRSTAAHGQSQHWLPQLGDCPWGAEVTWLMEGRRSSRSARKTCAPGSLLLVRPCIHQRKEEPPVIVAWPVLRKGVNVFTSYTFCRSSGENPLLLISTPSFTFSSFNRFM